MQENGQAAARLQELNLCDQHRQEFEDACFDVRELVQYTWDRRVWCDWCRGRRRSALGRYALRPLKKAEIRERLDRAFPDPEKK